MVAKFAPTRAHVSLRFPKENVVNRSVSVMGNKNEVGFYPCLLYTSDAADEEDSVDLGGRRIIKKKI